jgi:hypothetical protein
MTKASGKRSLRSCSNWTPRFCVEVSNTAFARVVRAELQPFFIVSGLIWMNSLAAPKKPKKLAPYGKKEASTDWILLQRGVVSITLTAWPLLLNGDLAPILHHGDAKVECTGATTSAEDHLQGLKHHIECSLLRHRSCIVILYRHRSTPECVRRNRESQKWFVPSFSLFSHQIYHKHTPR